MSDLPRATARVIGGALHAFIDAAVSAVEGAARAELPAAPAPRSSGGSAASALASTQYVYGKLYAGRSRVDDLRWAISKLAHVELTKRGFDVRESAELLADQDTYRVRARHRCGSLLVVRIAGEALLAAGDREAVHTIIAALGDAGCCCVPREVPVPCTARRCDEDTTHATRGRP